MPADPRFKRGDKVTVRAVESVNPRFQCEPGEVVNVQGHKVSVMVTGIVVVFAPFMLTKEKRTANDR